LGNEKITPASINFSGEIKGLESYNVDNKVSGIYLLSLIFQVVHINGQQVFIESLTFFKTVANK